MSDITIGRNGIMHRWTQLTDMRVDEIAQKMLIEGGYVDPIEYAALVSIEKGLDNIISEINEDEEL